MILPIPKASWRKGESQYRSPYIRGFSNFGDAHKILNSVALDWGEINSMSTVLKYRNGEDIILLKNYICSGHGGYLLYTTFPIKEFFPFISPYLSPETYTDSFRNYWKEEEFYVHKFEEDCDWSLLFLLFKGDALDKIEKDWRSGFTNPPSQTLYSHAKTVLNNYFPNVLRHYGYHKLIN